MKLHRIPDDIGGLIFYQWANESEDIILGLHPVLYGFRVMIHPGDSRNVWGSFCGGADPLQVQDLFSVIHKILSDHPWDPVALQLATSGWHLQERVRPWGGDPNFQKLLRDQAGDYPLVTIPDLTLIRAAMNLIQASRR